MNHVAKCPDCGEERPITSTMASMIRTGRSSGRCHPCGFKHAADKRRRGRRSYFATCPDCGAVREVAASMASMIRTEKRPGYCRECCAKRSAIPNSGQFQKGIVPHNFVGDHAAQNERRRIYKLRWRERNRKHVRTYFRRYYDEHIVEERYARRVSHLKRRGAGPIDAEIANKVMAAHTVEGRLYCYLCSQECDDCWEFDHVVPIAKGGTSEPGNIRIACRPCNRHKASKLLPDFIADRLIQLMDD